MWTLGEIASEVNGRLSESANPDAIVQDFQVRAWSCGPGSMFLPIFNAGPAMTGKAVKRGAVGALVDTHLPDSVPHIWVYDLQSSALKLAKTRRASCSGQVVGITGSAGKSSTKTMLQQVLQSTDNIHTSRNNQNLTPYVTATLCSLPQETDVTILELAMYSPDMVGKSSNLARPHIGIITSIGMNHAEYHENPEEGIIRSKTELYWGMEDQGTAILPTSDPAYGKLRQRAIECGKVARIISCGNSPADDVRIIETIEHSTYTEVTISAFGETECYSVSVAGMHMVQNSLLVAATLKTLGKPLSLMQNLRDYKPPRSSIRRFRADFSDRQIEVIDDAIISSPHQVRALLQIIAKRDRARRRVLVFGDMTALGPTSIEQHVSLASEIMQSGVDKFIAVGPHSAQLAKNLTIPTLSYKNAFEAAAEMSDNFDHGDLVIFKASGPTNFKHVLKAIYKRAKFTTAPMDWTIESET